MVRTRAMLRGILVLALTMITAGVCFADLALVTEVKPPVTAKQGVATWTPEAGETLGEGTFLDVAAGGLLRMVHLKLSREIVLEGPKTTALQAGGLAGISEKEFGVQTARLSADLDLSARSQQQVGAIDAQSAVNLAAQQQSGVPQKSDKDAPQTQDAFSDDDEKEMTPRAQSEPAEERMDMTFRKKAEQINRGAQNNSVSEIKAADDFVKSGLPLDEGKGAAPVAVPTEASVDGPSPAAPPLPPPPPPPPANLELKSMPLAAPAPKPSKSADDPLGGNGVAAGTSAGSARGVAIELKAALALPSDLVMLKDGGIGLRPRDGKGAVVVLEVLPSSPESWTMLGLPAKTRVEREMMIPIKPGADGKERFAVLKPFGKPTSPLIGALETESQGRLAQAAAIWHRAALEGIVKPAVAEAHLKRLADKMRRAAGTL